MRRFLVAANTLAAVTLFALSAVCLPLTAAALTVLPPPTPLSEITENGEYYHNSIVYFRGEVIGDFVAGSETNVWLALYDEGTTLSVMVDAQLAEKITHLGRYKVEGSTVDIRGEFHLVCEEHGGLSDVHGVSLEVFASGGAQLEQLDFNLMAGGLVLVLVGGVLTLIYRLMLERSR